ncbi:cupin domain-containing protein [Mycobacterium sp. 852002-51057_SCH5723018]|uniref:cupin domain-containing protein n=1 Tax=Mycobacterium sp. 852002-51057_SCH5723018 TaxID=1834094 RepID=UPI000800CB18|nr:cupin domain-containing protein [Mycobacterium sp. 852002-51057_SCH5723018]OBG29516.1 cupin [Mycobacterium sp. 852002-51057_SCH5723018]
MTSELPDWAESLNLSAHPEGGWFRETWRSDLTISQAALPAEYGGPRSAGTAILFLLMPGEASAWHAVLSAELWFFHRGSPLVLDIGCEPSTAVTYALGAAVNDGQQPQLLVPPGYWQRARPLDGEPSLVSCVVVPGFDFADFRMTTPRH